ADGKLLFKSSLPLGSSDTKVVDPASLRQAMATRQPVIGKVMKGPRGNAAVPVRVPVVIDGRLRYVLTTALRPDRMLRILKNQNVPQYWAASIVDGYGLRVARSKDHERTVGSGVSATLNELLRVGLPEGTGISTTTEGDESITGYTRVPRHNWVVAIGAPTARVTEVLRRTLAAYSVAIIASLALYLALAVFISKRLVLSIADLKEQTARLGQKRGVRAVRSPIREVNEIGESLVTASAELVKSGREREALVVSLRGALDSLKDALARAEQAAATKDNFLAVLGHELRNPLAPMVMALDLMDMKAGPDCLRERQTMRRQVNHMRRLVDDLLDVSRITQGKLAMAREPVCLATVVMQAADAVRPALAAAGRQVIESAEEVWVTGDETRLVQVATNLLANAQRYGGSGDVHIGVRRDGANALLTVTDQGVGMDPATAALVFQPFYQAPQQLARSFGGLGLGLPIVYSIVELLGGSVRASSEGLGKGSEFAVALPAIDGPVRAHAEAHAVPAAARRRVMIVDDNVDAATTTAELLAVLGHEVAVAHDGKSALLLVQQMRPDVAIFDIGLPDIDGYQLAQAVRRLGFAGKLVALTGYGQQRDKHLSAEAGFDLHLTKPVDLEALERAVDAGTVAERAAGSLR
ncbi:MAG: ATP-binding protein, partial [Telluria sp.]